MTEKQKDYIKVLLNQELDFGFFQRYGDALLLLGGKNWEDDYINISYRIANEVIKMLKESQTQSDWAWNNGYV